MHQTKKNKMKIKLKLTALALSAAMGLFNGSVLQAHEHDEKAEKGHKEGKEMKMPDTIGGIWHEIQEHKEGLAMTIKVKELADVHKTAFEIRDFAKALLAKSKSLPAEKMTRLQSAVKQIEKIASDLDSTGDAGDQAGTEANFKKLEGALKLVEAQYSPEMLKSKEMSQYTCPMHPDVVSDKPGKCSQCSMDLVVKK